MKIVAVAGLLSLVACASANDTSRTLVDAEPVDSFVTDGCAPLVELCNGRDDDCDTQVDEDFPMKGLGCMGGLGACARPGLLACNPAGELACDAVPGMPGTESCDGVDEDCDGMVDEDFQLGMPCDGADADACNEGVLVCDGAGGVTCNDATTNSVELCNGVDDDCQNGIDDTFALGGVCSVGLGACARAGVMVCDGAMTGTTCDAVAGAPSAETCGNAMDEDCNGADASCPSNDTAAGAIDISAGGTFTVDLVAAHDDNWTPSTLPQFDCGDQGGRDVFYTFTLPAEEVVYFDTFGSNFDSVVRVFAGACTALGATKACSDDSCGTTRAQGAVDLPAGQYCLVVDQFDNGQTTGSASLVFKRGGRAGTVLAFGTGTATSSVAGTTTGGVDLSVASCEANTHQPDVAFAYVSCPTLTRTVSVNTCTGTAFDTVLSMRTGLSTGADIACSDDVAGCGNGLQAKIVSKAVTGASLQWVILDGFGTTGNGAYTLSYSIQ
ncbi:MAG: MopE-related protein [Proteobacteria bacterium]|nr:MopE-related protein [Pseudomonadota bacterium]